MNRRSFLIGLGSTGLTAGISSRLKRLKPDDAGDAASYWDALGREEKMLRMAERVVPGTGLEQLTITQADLNDAVPVYELYQSKSAGTPFVNWLAESDIAVSPSDIAVRAYSITDNVHLKSMIEPLQSGVRTLLGTYPSSQHPIQSILPVAPRLIR